LSLLLLFSRPALGFSAAYKVAKLRTHQASSSSNNQCLELDDRSFDLYTQGTRNYTLVLLITAMDSKFGCQPCRLIDPAFRQVASSYWMTPQGDGSALFFGILDFNDGQQTYQKLGFESAPTVMLVAPTEVEQPSLQYSRYELSGMETFDADALAMWISGQTQIPIKVYRPPDYVTPVLSVLGVMSVLAALKLFWSRLYPIITNNTLWSTGCLMFIIHMCSGFMYNRIRGAQYAGVDRQTKQIQLFSSSEGQFQIEIQIVSVTYAALALCVIFMTKRIPKIQDVRVQRLTLYTVMAVFLAIYSWLISIFRFKNGGYPFKLLL